MFFVYNKDVVINMVRKMIVFLSLLVILVCVICIFYARNIAKTRFKLVEENKMTLIIKTVSVVVTIGMMCLIYVYK